VFASVALLLGNSGALSRLNHDLMDRPMDATVGFWLGRLRGIAARPRRGRTGEQSELDDLCLKLKKGLGPFGYQWLCACAVYPGLRLPITSYLGAGLARAVDRKLPDEAEHMALARLPWFRVGWMPDELRLRLLRDLEPPFRNLVREAIERLIFEAAEHSDRPQLAGPAEIARPPAGWSKGFRAWLKTPAGAADGEDMIFVRYMLGGVPRAAEQELSRRLTRLLGPRLAGWVDRWTLLGLGVGILVLLLATQAGGLLRPLFDVIREHGGTAETFRECKQCPVMVVVPAGRFLMGSSAAETGRGDSNSAIALLVPALAYGATPSADLSITVGPAQPPTTAPEAGQMPAPQPLPTAPGEVTLGAFALGQTEVTFDEWDACVADGGCNKYSPADEGWGRGKRPVINVSWDDAQAYVSWLSRKTGRPYRLPSEAEWEYAARGGTQTAYPWGEDWNTRLANGADSVGRTTEVATYAANPTGFYDMIGNVWEWVEDCWHDKYTGAPADGKAWVDVDGCKSGRVVRGGSWDDGPAYQRVAIRYRYPPGGRIDSLGFRVARTLTPGNFTTSPRGGIEGAAPGRENLAPQQQQAAPPAAAPVTKTK
jgi:formylglycine-generating enzyme required for sulfatase activity